jgi:hypothetical protein
MTYGELARLIEQRCLARQRPCRCCGAPANRPGDVCAGCYEPPPLPVRGLASLLLQPDRRPAPPPYTFSVARPRVAALERQAVLLPLPKPPAQPEPLPDPPNAATGQPDATAGVANPPPDQPVSTAPGSAGKVEALAERARKGLPLFDPADALPIPEPTGKPPPASAYQAHVYRLLGGKLTEGLP